MVDRIKILRTLDIALIVRLYYVEFINFTVGSGVIEAACENVIGKRLKQSGMMWSVAGANKISALRCTVLSGGFEPKQQETACFFAHCFIGYY